jgi:pyrroline-5-carboxylate reductase
MASGKSSIRPDSASATASDQRVRAMPTSSVAAMSESRLTIIGGGNMGAALLGGLLSAGWAPAAELAVVEVLPERRSQLAEEFPSVSVLESVGPCRAAVIAVKPGQARDAVAAARDAGARRVLSIAAGVGLAQLEAAAGQDVAVVRAMPNTPALVGQGAAAISAGSAAGDDDLEWAESILRAVGTVVRVPEPQLDAVTGLTGSGPAYIFLVAEALADAGVLAGLSRDHSEALVTQLLVGSAALLAEHGNAPALRAMVTSPGGTTAAGLHALEQRAVRAAFIDAVAAASARSRELGGA